MIEFKRHKYAEQRAYSGLEVNLKKEAGSDNVFVFHPESYYNTSILAFEEYPKLAEYLKQEGEYTATINRVSKLELSIELEVKDQILYEGILLPEFKAKARSTLEKNIGAIAIALIILFMMLLLFLTD